MNVWVPNSYMRLADIPVALFVGCIPGGFAGGFAYWAAAGRFLASQHNVNA
jgi:hypothetical protein